MMDHFINKRRLEIGICLFLVVATFVVYARISGYNFVNYDDELYVIKNPFIKAGFSRESIVWAFTSGYAANWHPLTWLSHMLDMELFGLNPMGHHWTSLQIHIVNVVLLFLFLKWMTGAVWKSAFVSTLFAIHPLHVESVAWISERKDVLCAFFWILSTWAYVGYVRRPEKKRYIILLVLFTLGLMSKPMIVTLPFTLLLLDYWPLERFQSLIYENKFKRVHAMTTLVLEKLPLFVLSVVSSVITFFVQQHAGAVAPIKYLSLNPRIANAIVSYVSYIVKMIWPLNLAILYPFQEWHPEHVLMSGTMILVTSIWVIKKRRRFPYLIMGWFWYLGTMVPVIGLVQVGAQSMADRYTYIPLIGLFIAISWGMGDITAKWPRQKTLQNILAGVVITFFAIIAWFQVGTWENGITLFSNVIKNSPNNSIAYCELGRGMDRHGRYDEAVRYYLKALQINPNYAEAHYELGVTMEEEGHSKEALKHYQEALRIKPDYAKVYNNIGVILSTKGNLIDAVHHYQRAIKINPTYAIAYYNLGIISTKHDRVREAISYYQKALQFNFNMTQALYQLSWILATCGDAKYRNGKEALKLAEKLCKVTQYRQPLSLDALAAAYAETKKFDKAILTAQKGIELAEQQGAKELSFGIQKRLELYKKAQPYRQNLNNKNES
jgi:tetratricopeptide (TPR) repeat protein